MTRPTTHGPAFVHALASLLGGGVTHDEGLIAITPYGIVRCSFTGAVYLNATQQVGMFSDGPEVIAAQVRAAQVAA